MHSLVHKFLKITRLYILPALILCLSGWPNAQAEIKTIFIGSHIPLTGSLARVGQGMNEGIHAAVAMMNQAYAGRYQFKVVVIDDETSPAKAVDAVEKLSQQGVLGFTAGYGSNIIGPASESAHKNGIAYITSGGVSPALTGRGYKGFFRINNTQGYSKAVLGLLKKLGTQKVTVLYSNKEATTDLANNVTGKLLQDGIVARARVFSAGTMDFKPLVNVVRLSDKPEVIVMVGYEDDYIGILRAVNVLKPDVKAMVGVWSLATPEMAKEFPELMEGVYGTSMMPYPVVFSTPEEKKFAAAYQKIYKGVPDYLVQFGYVQTQLLLQAIVRADKAGKLNRGQVIQELAKSNEQTLIGTVRFDNRGDNPEFSHRMGQHRRGKIVLVWP